MLEQVKPTTLVHTRLSAPTYTLGLMSTEPSAKSTTRMAGSTSSPRTETRAARPQPTAPVHVRRGSPPVALRPVLLTLLHPFHLPTQPRSRHAPAGAVQFRMSATGHGPARAARRPRHPGSDFAAGSASHRPNCSEERSAQTRRIKADARRVGKGIGKGKGIQESITSKRCAAPSKGYTLLSKHETSPCRTTNRTLRRAALHSEVCCSCCPSSSV